MVPSTIRAEIIENLSTITGLHPFEFEPDIVVAPACIVGMLTVDYNSAMGNKHEATVPVTLVVKRISNRAGQKALDGYLASTGATSVKAAIESDPTLDGNIDALIVESATPGLYESGGISYLAYRFNVKLYA